MASRLNSNNGIQILVFREVTQQESARQRPGFGHPDKKFRLATESASVANLSIVSGGQGSLNPPLPAPTLGFFLEMCEMSTKTSFSIL